ncbi:unnamed protein product [Paramecium sonneborni]|uniref:G domain-containing protein n=1 Tax=Paramecium sonneborni TaxID=65129 RepID=A0A8S1QKL0_9CILI|nr:unnamed protein product [Paramecium sonneborni]
MDLSQNIYKLDLEQQINDKDYLLLIGPTGVGKSKLFNQMKLEQINSQFRNRSKSLDDIKNSDINNETKIFKEGILDNQYIIVDTPSLQLQDDIDTRELIIKHFQDYISSRKYISSLAIVLNFERTDLMKSKALQVVKYLRKFIKIISIIIVNMELSENEEEDQQHLINSFKFIQYNQIIFIKKQMNQQQILEQIKKIKFIKTKIDFEDTVFKNCRENDDNINKMQQLIIRKIQSFNFFEIYFINIKCFQMQNQLIISIYFNFMHNLFIES